jgi:uncharacterized protein YjiS (DUF1127 family)
MSTYSQEMMRNHHVVGVWTSLSDTFHLWRQRYRTRQELARWTDRDLHDVGISWSDIVNEAEKPFWRA